MRSWLMKLVVAGVLLAGTNATKCSEENLRSGPEIASLLKNGTRVVRGKNWNWENQDGGPGHEGRITNMNSDDGWVEVEWDTGYRNSYRMGSEGNFDLQLACSGLIDQISTTNTSCAANSNLSGAQLASIFKIGTRVVRGQDWKWESQDGGPGREGRITNTNNGDGWVEVEWDTGDSNSYRMGYDDKYDLQLACSESQRETGRTNTSCAANSNLSGPQLASIFKIGTRVVRGQDWKWDSQDGGPGLEGSITDTNDGGGWVKVEWDTGDSNSYRMGFEDKYDLQLTCSDSRYVTVRNTTQEETAPTIQKETVTTRKEDTVTTPQEKIETSSKEEIETSSEEEIETSSEVVEEDIEIYSEAYTVITSQDDCILLFNTTSKVAYSGPELAALMKVGTRVVRGKDWNWGDQDGGPGREGRITNTNDGDGWVKVEWDTGDSNSYRMGYDDKYDLQLSCSESQRETGRTNTSCAANSNLSGPQLASIFKIGTRVVRGQDWKWESQDGGPGLEGSITNTNDGDGWVRVEWDMGDSNSYRMGFEDKYDLQLACSDSQYVTVKNTTQEKTATTIQKETVTTREEDNVTTPQEEFESSSSEYDIETYSEEYTGTVMTYQDDCILLVNTTSEVAYSGPELATLMKVGTRVVRGKDWNWGDQDGGPGREGRITDTDSGDGWVTVEWDTGDSNEYQMGAGDKYDLQLACSDTQNETNVEVRVIESTIKATKAQLPTTLGTVNVNKNVQEGNEVFGTLVGKEIASVPRRYRIQTMQDILEIFKKNSKY